MPVLKLYYFDFPFWRAEVSRLALHLGDVSINMSIKAQSVLQYYSFQIPFENATVKYENLKEFKESGVPPLGQLPVLEVDGKVVAQTGAIARYCGKLGGLYPRDDDFAAAKIDEIIDTATDMTNLFAKTMKMTDQNEKIEARKQMAKKEIPFYLKALEKIMTQNGSTGFFVGSKMTIADIAMWGLFTLMIGGKLEGMPTNILDSYPQLMANMKAIGGNPKISAWMVKQYAKGTGPFQKF